MNERNFYIGEVAKDLQISQRTIRYYEERGFIKPGRTDGKFRVYAESEVNRLRTVLYLKELGMTLEEIGELLKLVHEGSVHEISPKLREAIMARKKDFEAKFEKYRDGIKEMESLLQLVERCIKCNKKTDEETCQHCIDKGGLPPTMRALL